MGKMSKKDKKQSSILVKKLTKASVMPEQQRVDVIPAPHVPVVVLQSEPVIITQINTRDQRIRDYSKALRQEMYSENNTLAEMCESLVNDNKALEVRQENGRKELLSSISEQSALVEKLSAEIKEISSRKIEEKYFVTNNVNIVEKLPKSYLVVTLIVVLLNIILIIE